MATTEGLGFELSEDETYYIVYGDNRSLVSVEIPETHDGKQVKEIKAEAFSYYSGLREIIIPNTIEKINDKAFYYCENLNTITFENNSNLTTIGEFVFSYCHPTTLEIPNGVTTLGNYCFYDLTATTLILPKSIQTIGSGSFTYSNISEVKYNGNISDWCKINLSYNANPMQFVGEFYFYINGNYEQINKVLTIPDDVTEIKNYAFAGLKNIDKLIVSNSVTSIGYYSFQGLNIKNVILENDNDPNVPHNLTTINGRAFLDCSLLENIFIPSSVTTINSTAFTNTNIQNILYGGTEQQWGAINITGNLLNNVKVYYYSEHIPDEDDKYWHYNENNEYVVYSVTRTPLTKVLTNNTIKDGYKIMIVPIKINTTYTIYIDSSIPIYIGSIYYDGVNVLTDEKEDGYELYDYISKTNCSFNQPFTYRVEEESTHTDKDGGDSNITILQNQLVMLIQIPEINTSTVLILEGDYTGDKLLNITADDGTKIIEENGLKKVYYGKPLTQIQESELIDKYFSSVSSLTQVFDGQNYAFNDRLIEYLLLNVIDREEQIGENIQRIQEYLSSNKAEQQLNSRYKKSYIKGVWDLSLREYIYNLITQRYKRPIGKDINGFVDKDTEEIINQCKPNPKD